MKFFRDLFHSELVSPSPQNDTQLQKLQRNYSLSHSDLCAALDMQSVIIKHMKRMSTMETETCIDDIAEQSVKDAMTHNLQRISQSVNGLTSRTLCEVLRW